jgi:hypothetical protein
VAFEFFVSFGPTFFFSAMKDGEEAGRLSINA